MIAVTMLDLNTDCNVVVTEPRSRQRFSCNRNHHNIAYNTLHLNTLHLGRQLGFEFGVATASVSPPRPSQADPVPIVLQTDSIQCCKHKHSLQRWKPHIIIYQN